MLHARSRSSHKPAVTAVSHHQPVADQHRCDGGAAIVSLQLRIQFNVLPIRFGVRIRHCLD